MLDRGIKNIGEGLVAAAEANNLAIILQPAGLAHWHDSFDLLQELRNALIDLGLRQYLVAIQTSRNIWAQVAAIAGSACFVGTSLHGRVVATSFGIPRVALENEKVAKYAETWENGLQPANIPVEMLSEAISSALSVDVEVLDGHSRKLHDQTYQAFSDLRNKLMVMKKVVNIDSVKSELEKIKYAALQIEAKRLRYEMLDLACSVSNNLEAR